MPEICVVTGADKRYFDLLRAMLNSLAVNNDLGLPVMVLDMGLRPDQVEWLQKHPLNARVRSVGTLSFLDDSTVDFRKITKSPGQLTKLRNWYSKLNILYLTEFERLFWVDADCLFLEPISSMLPADRHVAFSATRGRRTPGFEFSELYRRGVKPIAPNLVAEFVERTSINKDNGQLFNSGVMYLEPESLRTIFERYRLAILDTFWAHASGDQAIFILIILCMRSRFEFLPEGVNIAPNDNFEEFEIRAGRRKHPGAYVRYGRYFGNVKLLHMISDQKPSVRKKATPSLTDRLFQHYHGLL
jgi:lipopolysaccharide biosynthesis glycosyltransferase